MSQWHERVENDDPDRCQSIEARGGQCHFRRVQVPGAEKCWMHGGHSLVEGQKKESLGMYRLAKYKARVGEFSDSPLLLRLDQELGILRMTLERTLTRCRDDSDLMASSGRISAMILQIQKLVESISRERERMEMFLSRDSLDAIAGQLINALGDSLSPEKLNEVIRILGE